MSQETEVIDRLKKLGFKSAGYSIKDVRVEHGIPMPDRTTSRWVKLLKTMKHGDSIVIPRKWTGALYSYAKKLHKKFICQVIDRQFCRSWLVERGRNGQN